MKKYLSLSIVISLLLLNPYALRPEEKDRIVVFNQTDKDNYYCGLYERKEKTVKQLLGLITSKVSYYAQVTGSPIFLLPPGSSTICPNKIGQYLVASNDKEKLKAEVATNVTGVRVYAFQKNKNIFITAPENIVTYLNTQIIQYTNNQPYARTDASVRQLTSANDPEVAFRLKRREKTREALKSLGFNANPSISLCFSGGGCRAMLITLGFLQAFEQEKMLDTVMDTAVLSGSSWCVLPWLAAAKPDLNKMQVYLRNQLNVKRVLAAGNVATGISNDFLSSVYSKAINGPLLRKILDGQPIALVDIYGFLLANMFLSFLGKNMHNTTFSSFQGRLKDGTYPLPIGTAMVAYTGDKPYKLKAQDTQGELPKEVKFAWFDFTPYSVTNLDGDKRYSVPMWAFNRMFNNGQQTKGGKNDILGKLSWLANKIKTAITQEAQVYLPEESISFLMGTFGSAFAANLDLALKTAKLGGLVSFADKMTSTPGLEFLIPAKNAITEAGKGAPAGVEFNFLYKIPSQHLADSELLNYADAGIDMILPIPPLLEKKRATDIIIICDTGGDVRSNFGNSLLKAANYADENKLSFTPISMVRAKIEEAKKLKRESDIMIIQGKAPVPTVIYIPMFGENKNGFDPSTADYTGTFNFDYEPEKVDIVVGYSREKVITLMSQIKDAIRARG